MPKDFLSDEDRALFRAVTASVTPLKESAKQKTIREDNPTLKTIPPKKKNQERTLSPRPSLYLSNQYPDEVLAETTLSYCQHSIPKKRFIELQKGKIPWERRIDLHGFKQDEASIALLNFIQGASEANLRTLLVIHGKGGREPEKAPVLKNLVNYWLPQIPEVLAFHSAAPKDGGNGALYVLLKRNRT